VYIGSTSVYCNIAHVDLYAGSKQRITFATKELTNAQNRTTYAIYNGWMNNV